MTPTQTAAIDSIISQIQLARESIPLVVRFPAIATVEKQTNELIRKLEELKTIQ